MNDHFFRVIDLSMKFGGLLAVQNFSLHLQPQEIVSLIGPNGAGKTTIFNCLTGFYYPTGGSIQFKGKELIGLSDQQIARSGIVRTFQHVRLFKEMTVIENLLVAQYRQQKVRLISGFLNTKSFRLEEEKFLEYGLQWLDYVGLLPLANHLSGNLAYGQQRRLEIARCMATQPDILLLDEPAAGLNPQETLQLTVLLTELCSRYQIGIILIEHDMKLVMDISNRIYVINQGVPLAHGIPEEIQSHPSVIRAYLGEC